MSGRAGAADTTSLSFPCLIMAAAILVTNGIENAGGMVFAHEETDR
jgi:hypothetical protein